MWLVLFSALVLAQVPDAGRSTVSAPYVDRVLTSADLEGRSPEELVLMRNTIYARAGRTFKNPKLREYFGAQPWYHPTTPPNKLTAIDAANVRSIAARERALMFRSITATCPAPWTAGEVPDPVVANRLAGLARKLTWDVDYGPPTTCERKVNLDCGPDLDGDGLPEAIVAVTWKLMLNGRTCATVRDHNDYWRVKKIFLILRRCPEAESRRRAGIRERGVPGQQRQRMVRPPPRRSCGRGYVPRQRDVRQRMRVGRNHHLYAMDQGRLRKKETRDRGATVPTVKLPAPLAVRFFRILRPQRVTIQFETGRCLWRSPAVMAA